MLYAGWTKVDIDRLYFHTFAVGLIIISYWIYLFPPKMVMYLHISFSVEGFFEFMMAGIIMLFSLVLFKLLADTIKRLQSSCSWERFPSKTKLTCKGELTVWVSILSICYLSRAFCKRNIQAHDLVSPQKLCSYPATFETFSSK